MEKLVLEENNDAVYRLQINDSDTYIEFDLLDMSLPVKILNATEKLEKIDEDYANKTKEIEENEKDEVEKARKLIKLDEDYAKEMRNNLDSFLGEGACQKIFGDKERYGQYNRLMGALTPHFEKMRFDIDKAKKRIIEELKKAQNSDVM